MTQKTDEHAPRPGDADARPQAPDARPAGAAERTAAGAPERSAFANVRIGDYLRDALAVVLLLTALALPWDLAHRGSDRAEVVVATVASLLSVALPYLARVGALPATWTVHSTRRARVVANAPFFLVTAVYLVVDLVQGGGDGEFGGVNTGFALGLAGAVLAASPRESELGPPELDAAVAQRWRTVFLGGGILLAVAAVAAFVIHLVAPGVDVPVAVAALATILVLALDWYLVRGTLRRDEATRLVLVATGAVAAVVYLLTSGDQLAHVESLHGARFGLLLLPALAVLAASPAVRRGVGAQVMGESVDIWVRVAVRALTVVAILGGYVTLVAVALLVFLGFDVTVLLRLILGAVVTGLAVLARRSLVRDATTGHVPAVGLVCVIGVLGLVIVVATSTAGSGVDLVDLLLAFGLPGTAAYALMVPRAVREHFSTEAIGGDRGVDRTQAYVWAPRADAAPVSLPTEPARPAGERDSGRPAPAAAETAVVEPVGTGKPRRVTSSGASNGTRPAAPRTGARTGAQPAAQPAAAPRTAAVRPPSGSQGSVAKADRGADPTEVIGGVTQVLPPVAPEPRWTPARALDPATPLADLARIVQEAPHLRPQVAANPSTYPALLDWLGALGDPEVDAALRARRS